MPTNGSPKTSLYYHIPFCQKKCGYCHFYVLPNQDRFHTSLMRGLDLEWALQAPLLDEKRIVSVYFGGGTPSLLGAANIGHLIAQSSALQTADCEITLEANPELLTKELIRAYKDVGVNRVSIGIQSLDKVLLKRLGRLHSADAAIHAVEATFLAGIENISVDLMYDLPGQTLESWQHTLKIAAALPITHLSLYNLTIEPHTAFFKYRDATTQEMPDEDTSLNLYQTAIEHLESAGLNRYEISAFARQNKRSIHNTGYWLGRPFLGFGPSAFSYWEGKRFRNRAHLNRYVQDLENNMLPVDFSESLDPKAHSRELLTIRLRLKEGIDLADFPQIAKETTPILDSWAERGFLKKEASNYSLSSSGLLFYDEIAADLI